MISSVRMKVVMDDAKIENQGEYSVAAIHNHLDNVFAKFDIKQTEEHIYTGSEEDESYMALVGILLDCEWFMDYVKEWVWIDEEEDYVEDLLA